ncbi:MAG: hypothetical protein PHD62_08485 [Bacteroidales bacterium]|nr:hypothetical protein [Bacteroidales bacterium]
MISTSSSINKANFAKAQAFSSTVQNELLLDLVSEWKFDDASNIGEDNWGNNDGTLYNFSNPATSTSGLVSQTGCVIGTCLNFDGVNDYINFPSSSILAGDQLTFALWNYGIDLRASSLIEARMAPATDSSYRVLNVHLPWHDSIVYFDAGGNSYDRISKAVTSSEYQGWHFWVFTKNSTTGEMKIFLDGSKWHSGTSLTRTIQAPLYVTIGGYINGGGNFHRGLMDELRIYNSTLSQTAIRKSYIAGLDSLLSQGTISKVDYNQKINELAYEK